MSETPMVDSGCISHRLQSMTLPLVLRSRRAARRRCVSATAGSRAGGAQFLDDFRKRLPILSALALQDVAARNEWITFGKEGLCVIIGCEHLAHLAEEKHRTGRRLHQADTYDGLRAADANVLGNTKSLRRDGRRSGA